MRARRASDAAYEARRGHRNRQVSMRAYRTAHRAEILAKQRVHDAAHRAETAAYRVATREARRAYSLAWRQAHREQSNAHFAAYKAAHPDRVREAQRKNGAKRRNAPACDHASCLTLGATQLAWQTNPHACHLCGTPVWPGVNLHMDHLIPISRGGIHCADNLRPACAPCNWSKGTSLLGDA